MSVNFAAIDELQIEGPMSPRPPAHHPRANPTWWCWDVPPDEARRAV